MKPSRQGHASTFYLLFFVAILAALALPILKAGVHGEAGIWSIFCIILGSLLTAPALIIGSIVGLVIVIFYPIMFCMWLYCVIRHILTKIGWSNPPPNGGTWL
jgi:hypothetical protein